jgi:hypothetical protein
MAKVARFLGKYTYSEKKGWKLKRDIWNDISSMPELENVKVNALRDSSLPEFFMRRDPRVLKQKRDGDRVWIEEVLELVTEDFVISEIKQGRNTVED